MFSRTVKSDGRWATMTGVPPMILLWKKIVQRSAALFIFPSYLAGSLCRSATKSKIPSLFQTHQVFHCQNRPNLFFPSPGQCGPGSFQQMNVDKICPASEPNVPATLFFYSRVSKAGLVTQAILCMWIAVAFLPSGNSQVVRSYCLPLSETLTQKTRS